MKFQNTAASLKTKSLKISDSKNVALALVLAIVLISTLEPYFTSVTLMVRASDQYEGPYLINEANTKVLRVPYLYQDHVGECWLYAVGMVVAYYGKQFKPDVVLNNLGFGFDRGLNIAEEGLKLTHIIHKLYEVELEYKYTSWLGKPSLLSTKSLKIDEIKKFVVFEIENERPIILLFSAYSPISNRKIGHAVVITGYSIDDSEFYLTINDPSGSLIFDVMKGNAFRIDGSEVYDYYHSYQVKVSLSELLQRVDSVNFLFVKTPPRTGPRPPRVTVYLFTDNPNAITEIYNVTRSSYHVTATKFYHNNYLERSLWYRIPIVKAGSNLSMYVFVYPNTNRKANFTTVIKVISRSTYGFEWQTEGSLKIRVINLSTVELKCLTTLPGWRCQIWHVTSVAMIVKVDSAGAIRVTVAAYDENSGSLEYEWGSFDLYVYDEVVSAHHEMFDVYAGILERINDGKRKVDLYFASRHNNLLSISAPCKLEIPRSTPDPRFGGYYGYCSTEVEEHDSRLVIRGTYTIIKMIKSEEFELQLDLAPPLSPYLDITHVEFRLKENVINLNFELCSYTAIFNSNLLLRFKIPELYIMDEFPVSLGQCFTRSVELRGLPVAPLVSIEAELVNKQIDEVKLLSVFRQAVNARYVEITRSDIPSHASPDSIIYISYVLSIPAMTELNPNNLELNSVITLNNTGVPSSSWVEDITYDPAGNRYLLYAKTAFRVPSSIISTSHYPIIYEVRLYPRLTYRQGRSRVTSYSPDIYVSGTLVVGTARPEVGNIAYVLVIDVSGSMGSMFRGKSKLEWAKQASLILLDLAMDGDLVGVVIFSNSPSVLQEIVEVNPSTRPKIAEKIAAIRAGGATNIGDSLRLATDMLKDYVLKGYKSVIILLTDGIHNTGTHPYHVLDYVRDTGVRVFTIGLGEPGDIDEDVLKTIADSTGGIYYYAPTPDLLKEIFILVRGMGLMTNQIESLTTTLMPYETVTQEYVIDLSKGDHVLEVWWSDGGEPEVHLSLVGVVVNQRNASTLGIAVSYPAPNTIRFTVPQNLSLIMAVIGWSDFEGIKVNLSIKNSNPFNTTLRLDLFGGREELLHLTLDNPAGRYGLGQVIYYKIATEANSIVSVQLEDSAGKIYYYATHTAPKVDLGSALEGAASAPIKPGVYYLKAKLFINGVLRKTVTSPVIVLETIYRMPLVVSVAISDVKGLGEISIPVTIRVLDSGVLNGDIMMIAKLNSKVSDTAQPSVYIEPAVLKLTRDEEKATIRIFAPIGSTPGRYNLSLMIKLRGHSTIILENLVNFVVPNISVSLKGLKDATVLYQGENTSIVGTLEVFCDSSYLLRTKIKPIFTENIVSVNGHIEYEIHHLTNLTTPVILRVSTKNIGVYQGRIAVYVNDTLILNLRKVVVVVPPEADLGKLIWGLGFGSLSIGPRGEISAQVTISGTIFSTSFISVPKRQVSQYDYLVYVSREPRFVKPYLVLFLGGAAAQFESVVVEEYPGIVSRYRVDPTKRVLVVELGHGELFRVWLEATSVQTVTTTITLIETTTTTYTLTLKQTETVREIETVPLYTTLYIDKYIVREHTRFITQRETYTIAEHISEAIYLTSIAFLLLVSIASLLIAVLVYKRYSHT